MRGHLAFLSRLNAVPLVGHQGLSGYCRTKLVRARCERSVTMPRNGRRCGKCAPLLTRVALCNSVSSVHSKNN